MKNCIPNQFNILYAKVLIPSTADDVGDILEVKKIQGNKNYLATNLRTGQTSILLAGLLKSSIFCHIERIQKGVTNA